jgi:hypothetical protein
MNQFGAEFHYILVVFSGSKSKLILAGRQEKYLVAGLTYSCETAFCKLYEAGVALIKGM